jgi:hypothetical protein
VSDGVYRDYGGGYPAVRGWFARVDEDLDRSIPGRQELLEALGVPFAGSADPTSLLFKHVSGILDDAVLARRYDCGCLYADPSASTDEPTGTLPPFEPWPFRLECGSLKFRQDGGFDWNPDRAVLEPVLTLTEKFGLNERRYDGSIPSHFELLLSKAAMPEIEFGVC